MSPALHALPKTELHLHIEGTLEPELALRLADRNGVTLPFDGIDDLRSHYRFDNLQSFLDLYYQLMSVLRTREDFSDLMLDYLAHAHADGVHRAEIFFDPQVHMNNGLDYDLVLDGLLDGIARGRAASGQGRDAHRAGPVEDGILRPAEIGGIAWDSRYRPSKRYRLNKRYKRYDRGARTAARLRGERPLYAT